MDCIRITKHTFCLLYLFLCLFLPAKAQEEVVFDAKADFIIDIGRKITLPRNPKSKTYKIGVYGHEREVKKLYRSLENRMGSTKVHGKQLEVFLFKRMSQVEQVDLLYVSGNSKIRISSLNEKLNKSPYFIVTENFPFGTSAFNFKVGKDNQILYEIQPKAVSSNGTRINPVVLSSPKRIVTKKDWENELKRVKQEVIVQQKTVEEQKDTISKQQVEIKKQGEDLEVKENTIGNQRKFLLLALLILVLAGALLFVFQKLYAERKRVSVELERKNKSIISSINYAKRIQDSILPAKKLFGLFLTESFILFKPKDIVSGDFYWLETNGDKVFFAVADCTGHGVPGAMMSVMCSNLLTKAVMEMNLQEPNEILDKAVELLEDTFVKSSEDMKDGMDITLCSYDIRKKELKYAGAYGALNLINKGKLQVIKGDRQPVGSHHFRKPFTNHTIQIEKGDCLYLSSDGFADQFGGPKNRKFMVTAFRLLLLDIHRKPMEEQEQVLKDSFQNWKGKHSQIDDVCVMGIRF